VIVVTINKKNSHVQPIHNIRFSTQMRWKFWCNENDFA